MYSHMKTYIYFHICCINNWPIIVANLHNDIKNSGLYDVVDEIRCGVLGEYDPNYEFFTPFNISNADFFSPEFWVCTGNGYFATLWTSNLNHYFNPYPPAEYENKEIQVKGIRK